MHHGSSFIDLIVWNVVVQTNLKTDISKESYRILKYKIYEKNVCMWRILFPIQTLMGHRRAAAGRAKGRALRRERERGIAFTFRKVLSLQTDWANLVAIYLGWACIS